MGCICINCFWTSFRSSKTIRTLVYDRRPSGAGTIPSSKVKKFIDRTLALKGGNSKSRGWERKAGTQYKFVYLPCSVFSAPSEHRQHETQRSRHQLRQKPLKDTQYSPDQNIVEVLLSRMQYTGDQRSGHNCNASYARCGSFVLRYALVRFCWIIDHHATPPGLHSSRIDVRS